MTDTCRTCAHWEPPANEHVGEIPGVGTCHRVPQYWDSGMWDEDGGRTLKEKSKSTLAFVADGSDYFARLLTFPDFGCVMHKKSKE